MDSDTSDQIEVQTIQSLNHSLRGWLGFEPITEFHEPTNEQTARMNYGLAQVYANQGFREYVQHEIDVALKATATRSITLVDMAAGKARALTLKELLIKGKHAFEELQKINKLKEHV